MFCFQRHHMLLELLTRSLQKSWEEDLCYCQRWALEACWYSLVCHTDTVFKQCDVTGSGYSIEITRLRCHMWVDCVVGSRFALRVLFRLLRSPQPPPPPTSHSLRKTDIFKLKSTWKGRVAELAPWNMFTVSSLDRYVAQYIGRESVTSGPIYRPTVG